MEDKIKSQLEKVYTEYIDYKEFLKDKIKRPEDIRKEVAQEIKGETDLSKIQNILFEKSEKQAMYQADFIGLQTRLFHTIENYKELMEIPQEIKTEVENIKFVQIFKIKNNTAIVVSEDVVNQAKENLKKALDTNFEMVTKFFGE